MFTDQKLVELYYRFPRLTYPQIATELGITKRQVINRIVILQARGVITRRFGTGRLLPTDAKFKKLLRIKELRNQGLSWTVIAREFNMSRQAVQQMITLEGMIPGKQYNISPDELVKLYTQNPRLTLGIISDMLGLPYKVLLSELMRLIDTGVLHLRAPPFDELESKLEKCQIVIALRRAGYTYQQIADNMDVAISSVYRYYRILPKDLQNN